MPPRRLFVYCARIGDLVLLTPLMRQLAKSGPLEVLGRPWARDLLQGQPETEAVHCLEKHNATRWRDFWLGRPRARLGRVLASRRFDEIVLFSDEGRRMKAWIEGWRGSAKVRAITLTSEAGGGHRTEAQFHALTNAGFDAEGFDPTPRLVVAASALALARERLGAAGRRVVLVQVGSSATYGFRRRQPNLKGLAPEQWAALLTGILARDEADAFVFVGVPPEAREVAAVMAALPAAARGRCRDLTSASPLAELPAWFAAAYAAISGDTGPAHIAAAVGCPLLVYFGPTDPRMYAPTGDGAVEILEGAAPCRPCFKTERMKSCRANVCLTSIPPATLESAWRRLTAKVAGTELLGRGRGGES